MGEISSLESIKGREEDASFARIPKKNISNTWVYSLAQLVSY
jgi:hypothetical protein